MAVKTFVKSVLLFPICLGIVLGSLKHVLGDRRDMDTLICALFLGLNLGVWFPFLLAPYLRRFSGRD